MKKIIHVILVLFFFLSCFSSCHEIKEKNINTKNTDVTNITIENGFQNRTITIKEFNYKGHLYIYNNVRDGISLTHAGHCQCNKSNM